MKMTMTIKAIMMILETLALTREAKMALKSPLLFSGSGSLVVLVGDEETQVVVVGVVMLVVGLKVEVEGLVPLFSLESKQ